MVVKEFQFTSDNATSVIVTGTFDDWSQTKPATKGDDGVFRVAIDQPVGTKLVFKFVVDGNWLASDEYPQETDPEGNVNNVYEYHEIATPVVARPPSPTKTKFTSPTRSKTAETLLAPAPAEPVQQSSKAEEPAVAVVSSEPEKKAESEPVVPAPSAASETPASEKDQPATTETPAPVKATEAPKPEEPKVTTSAEAVSASSLKTDGVETVPLKGDGAGSEQSLPRGRLGRKTIKSMLPGPPSRPKKSDASLDQLPKDETPAVPATPPVEKPHDAPAPQPTPAPIQAAPSVPETTHSTATTAVSVPTDAPSAPKTEVAAPQTTAPVAASSTPAPATTQASSTASPPSKSPKKKSGFLSKIKKLFSFKSSA